MTFSQFIAILKARWISAALVMTITLGSTIALSLLLPKQYTATTAVVLDVKSPDPISGAIFAAMMTPSYMATQVDIITSDRVARSVVNRLHLTENNELRDQWNFDTNGHGDFVDWIAKLLQKKLEVKPSRESNVVNISYTAPDPKFAAGLANTFVQAYIDTSLELRVDPAKQNNSFFDARVHDLRESLEKAQTKLSAYQKEHGIIANDERLDIENQRLSELTSQLVSIQAVSAESNSRNSQARTQADQLQDVINNPVIASLRSELSRQEARLQELNAKYGEAHPQVGELKANIVSLKTRIDTETRRVSGSLGLTNNINKSRESEIRSAIESQRTKILQLKERRDEVAVLRQEVEGAQKAYDMVAQRATQTSLESQSSQTNISILTPASEPSIHSSPKIVVNIIIALMLGTILALFVVLIRELLDRRIRTMEDISESLGLPVIGFMPAEKRRMFGKSSKFIMPQHLLGQLPGPGNQ
jgi:chain length determinant protein EpsF